MDVGEGEDAFGVAELAPGVEVGTGEAEVVDGALGGGPGAALVGDADSVVGIDGVGELPDLGGTEVFGLPGEEGFGSGGGGRGGNGGPEETGGDFVQIGCWFGT